MYSIPCVLPQLKASGVMGSDVPASGEEIAQRIEMYPDAYRNWDM